MPDRAFLERAVAELDEQLAEQEVPLPETWGGYQVMANRFEFWQGRTSRLHDRFSYRKEGDQWLIERLSP